MSKNQTISIKSGDQKAFDTFYRREHKKAFFYASQYLYDHDMAYDVVQESFMTLWEKRDHLDPAFPVQPYLYSIIKNKSLNLLQRLSVDKKIRNEILKREYRASMAALCDDSSDVVIHAQLQSAISKTYADLPKKISDTFTDSRIKGLTYQEIATKRGITVKVVEYHITQALKIFKEKLKDFLIF